ncbi:hypothetical protein H4J75_09425 [Colwellia sp. BRX10-1]|uniref:hypothetical protein n=2 Tax=Colwellia TaxID=28228 RepID=UPI0015F7608A|nr:MULTISPECIES: hypothetical protein [unclassified Colwellia]MBA6401106.1 hypothetical protein [Colwellia sp. BRX10-5]MBA6405721.1 hypothetical protein [Colwellia sp. BRX10-1]
MSNFKICFLLVIIMVYSSHAHAHAHAYSDSQVVADGLAIDLMETLDLTFQVIPEYDETENVLAGWNGDEFQYFVAFSKLPAGWLNAEKWISGFIRDIHAASETGSYNLLDKGNYKSNGKFDLNYIEISFIPKGEQETRKQLVHFITDHKNSYLAFATPTSDNGANVLQSEVISILKTSHLPTSNIIPLVIKNEDKYIGIWNGQYVDKDDKVVQVIFELKADLTFARKDSIEGKQDSVNSGGFFISNNKISWTYLYGKPTNQESRTKETNTISSFSGDTMILILDNSNIEIVLKKES